MFGLCLPVTGQSGGKKARRRFGPDSWNLTSDSSKSSFFLMGVTIRDHLGGFQRGTSPGKNSRRAEYAFLANKKDGGSEGKARCRGISFLLERKRSAHDEASRGLMGENSLLL